MPRLFIAIAVTLIVISAASCKKEQAANATLLTGTWIKGANAADTLYFRQNNGKNVLHYNISFNAALPAFTEIEYSFQNGKLALKNFMAAQNDFYVIESFNWKQEGKEFEVLGYQLFPIMSSTQARFTYRKIN